MSNELDTYVRESLKRLLHALVALEQVSSNENFYNDSTGESYSIDETRQLAIEALRKLS